MISPVSRQSRYALDCLNFQEACSSCRYTRCSGRLGTAEGHHRLLIFAHRLPEIMDSAEPLPDWTIAASSIRTPRGRGVIGSVAFSAIKQVRSGAQYFALEEPIGIGNAAILEGEAVQHRQPIKPVIISSGSHFELSGPSAQKRALERGGKLALYRQRHRLSNLARERAKASAVGTDDLFGIAFSQCETRTGASFAR